MPMAKARLGQIPVALAVIGAWLIMPIYGAQSADGFKMGVIDLQMVLVKSKACRKALEGRNEYVSSRHKALSRDEEELRNTEKTLKESKLSEGEKKEKEAQFRAKIQDYQKRAQEFNQELQGKQKELVDDYMKRIATATQTVAEKGGFSIVVDKGSEQTIKIVIYSKDTIDLTDLVIKEFDRVNSK